MPCIWIIFFDIHCGSFPVEYNSGATVACARGILVFRHNTTPMRFDRCHQEHIGRIQSRTSYYQVLYDLSVYANFMKLCQLATLKSGKWYRLFPLIDSRAMYRSRSGLILRRATRCPVLTAQACERFCLAEVLSSSKTARALGEVHCLWLRE